jgi:hypothetical protein
VLEIQVRIGVQVCALARVKGSRVGGIYANCVGLQCGVLVAF